MLLSLSPDETRLLEVNKTNLKYTARICIKTDSYIDSVVLYVIPQNVKMKVQVISDLIQIF